MAKTFEGEEMAAPGMCEEASPLSRERYIPCGKPATRMIKTRDVQPYRMCGACANHNVSNREAKDLGPFK